MSETKNIKMTDGPILSAVIRYSLPIVFAGMLQILFNAADLAVVGHFAGSAATAAVGATGSTISLIVNTVMGLAVGVNVVLARSLGAGERENSKRTVHTAIAVSVIAGIAVMIVGILISRPAMVYTRCPQDALEQAVQYMIIYFAGSPAIFVYNFGSAILRTKGDTKRPLYYLTAAGVANIFLNLLFVIVFRMAAAGVALATTLTQYLAAFLTIRCLMRQDDECRFVLRETHIWKSQLIGIIKYGLPSGITQAMYSISNIQIQSAINDFGTSAVAGNSASSNLEGFVSAGIAALNAATVAFAGQNIGAGNKKRVKKVIFVCLAVSVAFSLIAGFAVFFFSRQLIGAIYLPKDPEGVACGMVRAAFMMTTMWISGAFQVVGGTNQALGYSTAMMINSIVGICGVRTVWMQWFYPLRKSLEMIYICYPVTWAIILIANTAVLLFAWHRYSKKGMIK